MKTETMLDWQGNSGFCACCGDRVNSVMADHSFDHEFGTEKVWEEESPCCQDEVLERHPQSCDDCDYVTLNSECPCCAIANEIETLSTQEGEGLKEIIEMMRKTENNLMQYIYYYHLD